MNAYRAQFGRLLALDDLIRAGKCPNCSSFAREWEVSAKTVQRDVEFLRDSRGAPIEYDPDRRGYIYKDPSWRLESLDLSEAELLQLAVAERMAAQFRGTPISATLTRVFEKLRAALPGRTKIDPIDVHTRFSFHGHPVRGVPKTIWRTVARALRDDRWLQVTYRRYGAPAAKVHEVEPVHLASLDGEWTLVARIRGRDFLTLFSLSRVQRAKVLATSCTRIDFDPEQFFANRFGRFVGDPGNVQEITVRFTKEAAPGVLERTWHPKQSIEKHHDGSVVLRFPAPALYEVQRWVLQWGSEAEVLEPMALRRALRHEVRRLAIRYRPVR